MVSPEMPSYEDMPIDPEDPITLLAIEVVEDALRDIIAERLHPEQSIGSDVAASTEFDG